MNRPTYTPPPAPLGPPAPPVPPAPLPLLTAGEKVRHVAAFLGGASAGGGLVYGLGWAGLHGVLGWLEVGIVGLIGGSSVVLCCTLALLPVWREWAASVEADLWQRNSRAYWAAHYDAALAAQAAHTRALYRPARRDPGPVINHPSTPTVTTVTTPPPEPARAPAPVEPPASGWGERARRAVEGMLTGMPVTEAETPPRCDHPTQALPALPEGDRWRYQPRSPYTDDVRALVSIALATGTCTEPQAKACGIARRPWQRGCDRLAGVGVLAGEPGKPMRLSPRVARLRYDNDDAAVHDWVRRRLAE